MNPNNAFDIGKHLDAIPQAERSRVERQWQDYLSNCGDTGPGIAVELLAEALTVWSLSEFVAQRCVRYPQVLHDLIGSGDLFEHYPAERYIERLATTLADVTEENLLGQRLREFRHREMMRIAWRDLSGRAELNEVTRDLSHLADACLDASLNMLHAWHSALWGTPYGPDGEEQRLVILGMGKLGAHELNYSSDIDLIFAYPEDGETRGGRRSTTNQEFFIRLGQRLINSLDAMTAYGFVFRVDMRLRPFGGTGALAISFDAMEDYYQTHGREWERYAMIKARVVAGDKEAGVELLQRLRPFVYRKYVDFGVFESLREMKAMISREVQRKGMDDNVKLGAGGIREVEFIGQAFQLIRGGREPTLQRRRILTVLEALRGFGLLPDFAVDELTQAYIFLRNTEHRIQEYAEQQTHMLPTDEAARQRLAFAMGFADWSAFNRALRSHMRRVHEHFERVFEAPQTQHADSGGLDMTGVWQGNLDEEQAIAVLQAAGYRQPPETYRQIQALRNSRSFLGMSNIARQRMNHLMPLMLGASTHGDDPDQTLQRLLVLIESIARRSSYMALLVENPMALSQLVRLCSASVWVANQLARYPLLLDELLDPRSLYAPPRKKALRNELRQRMMNIDPQDLEAQMDALRHFKQANSLRVAAADLMEAVPLMVVSDHLTELAEVIVDAAFNVAWNYMVARHGRPYCGDARVCDSGFAIIGYGKMGGIELGYGSDLDIVFLHSHDSVGRTTNGERPVDNAVFYARLAQRLIHILNTRTQAGVLYEVDTRLRPSGASGLLVSSVDAFAEYQRDKAWTWEHQALVRARVVSGDAGIAEAFEKVRREILCRERDRDILRREVGEMRERMREHLSKAQAGYFDLKQDHGGIADIEFMVQYGVLAWAHKYPVLLDYTDNIRLLEQFPACGLLNEAESSLLCDAYRGYRAAAHRLTLQEMPSVVPESEFSEFRARVRHIWQTMMGTEEGN